MPEAVEREHLAREPGVTPRHLRFVLDGTRKFSPKLGRRTEAVSRRRLDEVEAQAARLRRILAGENGVGKECES